MSDQVKELPVVACRHVIAGLAMAAVVCRRGTGVLAMAAVAYRRDMTDLAMAAVAYRRVAIEARRRAAAAPLGLPLDTEVKKNAITISNVDLDGILYVVSFIFFFCMIRVAPMKNKYIAFKNSFLFAIKVVT
jgi:hypothetical protein